MTSVSNPKLITIFCNNYPVIVDVTKLNLVGARLDMDDELEDKVLYQVIND